MIDAFDVFAFVVFGVLLLAVLAIVVSLGALPGKIAARRGHPQAQAIAVAGWISLATVFALWPIAFIWAFVDPTAPRSANKGGPQP